MCLLIVGWNAHPDFRLVIAGNRDEFHDRPAAALGWWNDGPSVLAGRDLQASGTWLGLARDARFGIVTNFRDFDPPPPGAPSRGELVPSYLRGAAGPAAYLAMLESRARDYGGFNLLLGDSDSLHYFSNRGDDAPRTLPPGIYGLSNQWLDPLLEAVDQLQHVLGLVLAELGRCDRNVFGLGRDRLDATVFEGLLQAAEVGEGAADDELGLALVARALAELLEAVVDQLELE